VFAGAQVRREGWLNSMQMVSVVYVHTPFVQVSGRVHAFPSQLALPFGLNWQVVPQQELAVPLSAPSSHISPA
jgi:hypothetical protein